MQKKIKSKKLLLMILIVIITGIIMGLRTNMVAIDENQLYVKTKENQITNEEAEKNMIKEVSRESSYIKSELDKGKDFIYSNDYDVAIPIYQNVSSNNEAEQKDLLDTGAISYNLFGKAGEGNYDIFAHHGFNEKSYFTDFVNNLKKGDEVYVLSKIKDKYVKYTYEIDYDFIVDKEDVDTVYYKSEEPIITIGTCKVPYKTDYRIIWQGHLKEKNEMKKGDL